MTIFGTHWNTLDQTVGFGGSLSNGNLTYTQAGGQGTTTYVRSADAHASGKYYVEHTVGAVGGVTFWGPSLADVTPALSSSQLVTWGANGDVFFKLGIGGQTQIGTIVTYTTGDVLCIAWDLSGKFYGRKNAGLWNNSGSANPATGIGGITFTPTASMKLMQGINVNSGGGANFTLNAGQSAFAQAVPSGFTAGWPSLSSGNAMFFNTDF